MNFKTLLNHIFDVKILNEAPEQVGAAEKKERAKSATSDAKARDAARKRAERAKEIPRDRKPKQELLKDILLVKTRGGAIQLIFKDSFNASQHTKLNKDVLSMDEAKRATSEDKFEQTRASKLLLGDVKQKEEKERGKRAETGEEKERREQAKPKSEEEKVKTEKTKAKKMTQAQMFETMAQMTPEQLASMPPELRAQYFQMTRKPPTNNNFDKLSYENLSVEFGLSNLSNSPYNQQVLNALVFLAKLKAGASDQELQTYLALAPDAKDFTRSAFFTARKILSQIGDQCLQTLLTSVESGNQPVSSEGNPDLQCGNYKFKVAASGEISLSTNEFNQSNKNFKGFVARALTQTLMNPQLMSQDKKLAPILQNMDEIQSTFSSTLVPEELMGEIQKNPKLLAKLQNTKITGPDGKVMGTVIDENGQLNPAASLQNYQKAWESQAKSLLKGGTTKNLIKTAVVDNLLKTVLRGDGITDPEMAPNHLITINGIFPLTDDYFATIAGESSLDVTPSKDVISSSNITNYKPSAASLLKSFATVVEAVESKKPSIEQMLVQKDKINPMEIVVNHLVKANDFLLNASLLPGFNTKDLNAVQYNYITIGKKTVKIPVMKGENVTNAVLGECVLVLNDLIVEALSNNFVLSTLLRNELITDSEAELLLTPQNLLNEDVEPFMINLKSIFENAKNRLMQYPELAELLFADLVIEEYKRNYKQEYRNYHGKPKQRKERAARTKAREMMIKKGRAKKGDGKDIDHKRPLRHGGSKGINNLRVRDRSENRSDNGHEKGETQNKDWT
jgi:hypothetical protein